jgi:hypothetical protein
MEKPSSFLTLIRAWLVMKTATSAVVSCPLDTSRVTA